METEHIRDRYALSAILENRSPVQGKRPYDGDAEGGDYAAATDVDSRGDCALPCHCATIPGGAKCGAILKSTHLGYSSSVTSFITMFSGMAFPLP